MHTELKLHCVDSESVLREYVERRLNFALSRFGTRLARITTRISSLGNGKSEELSCRMTAELHPFGTITAEAIDTDIFSAVDRCAGRLARQCQTRWARRRDLANKRDSIRMLEPRRAA